MKRLRLNARIAACLRRAADKFAPGMVCVAPNGATLKVRAAFSGEAPTRDVGTLGERTSFIFSVSEWNRVLDFIGNETDETDVDRAVDSLKFQIDGGEWTPDFGVNCERNELAGIVVLHVYRVMRTR